MPDASLERTYEGKKEMLLMENVEDKEYLTDLFKAIYDELAAPKPRKRNDAWKRTFLFWTISSQSCESIK